MMSSWRKVHVIQIVRKNKTTMKHTHTLILIIIVALTVGACGAPATPTIAAADVQNTAMAVAFTIVAETQAAIPTNTAIPPTEIPTQTPPPTETPLTFPSLEATLTATQVVQAGGNSDPCNAPLKSSPVGRPTKIKLENQTGAPVTASVYLNLTLLGECGFRGYNIGKGGATTITDLVQGCYNVSVLVNDPQKPTKSFGYGCINNPDQWTFVIKRDNVTLQGR